MPDMAIPATCTLAVPLCDVSLPTCFLRNTGPSARCAADVSPAGYGRVTLTAPEGWKAASTVMKNDANAMAEPTSFDAMTQPYPTKTSGIDRLKNAHKVRITKSLHPRLRRFAQRKKMQLRALASLPNCR